MERVVSIIFLVKNFEKINVNEQVYEKIEFLENVTSYGLSIIPRVFPFLEMVSCRSTILST